MTDRPTDSELIERIREGDRASFTALYDRYQRLIINYLHKYLADYQAAEDVFQESFLDAYRRIREGRYREEGNFSSWLFRIATNFANKHLRHQKRMELTLDKPVGEDGDKSFIDLIPDRGADQADQTESKERRAILLGFLARLPKRHRQAILLHEIDGMKYKDIAKILSVTAGVVGVWVQRARCALFRMKDEKTAARK